VAGAAQQAGQLPWVVSGRPAAAGQPDGLYQRVQAV